MDDAHPKIAERIDAKRLRYWTQFLRLLRDSWPSRAVEPVRQSEPTRSAEPARWAPPIRFAYGPTEEMS
jgi:hypothetical protein